MRKLTRKQILARLFVGFFTIGSLLCTVNSAVAERVVYGKYNINNAPEWTTLDSSSVIQPHNPPSNNSVEVEISGNEGTTPDIYGGYIDSDGDVSSNTLKIITKEGAATQLRNVYGGHAPEGSVSENKVDITSSTIEYHVYGGSSDDNATGNMVKISDGSTINGMVYGGESYRDGNATGNMVKISDGCTINDFVYGGNASKGSVSENIVDIASSTINDVFGGCSYEDGNATGNMVKISDGSAINGFVYGGFSKDNATGNMVKISDGCTINNFVYGGRAEADSAEENIVDITSSKINSNVYGGSSLVDGNATGNMVKISDGSTIKGKVYGGESYVDGNATGNMVKISDGCTINNFVYGGYAYKGSVSKNIVDIASSKINSNVYGSYASKGSGSVSENKVDITSSKIDGYVYGGCSDGDGNATCNMVKISDGSTINGTVYGGNASKGSVSENKVDIASSKIDSNVYGGCSLVDGNATGNMVKISDSSTIGGLVYGGRAGMDGDSAKENEVDITSSKIDNNVYGGYASKGSVSENKVNVASSNISGFVSGGYVNGTGSATDNTVKLSGGNDVKGSVYGGFVYGTGNAKTDNKLIVSGTGNKIGGTVENFESVSFKLASDDDTTKPMLTIGNSMNLDQIKLDSELPEGGFNGERTLIDGNTLNYATATYTINGTAVDGDKSLTVAHKNESSVNVGFYKYALSESAIKLNAESIVAAVFQQTGKDPLSTDDRKIVVTSEMANKYSRIYGAFNADGKAATNATVELSEAVNNKNLTIYGGYSTGSGVDVTTGNTLKVSKNGNKIKNILNFSKLDFSLDSDNSNNPTMLALAADTVDLSKASINVNLTNALAEGQTVTLLGAAQQLSINNDMLTINNEKLDSDLSLKIADDSSKKYVNVAEYSLNNASGKLSIAANESFITSKYINGDKSKSVEKIDLTSDLSGFKKIYGSYSADNGAAEGGKLSISQKVDLSKTTLIGGKSAGNGEVKNNTLEISSSAAGSKVKGVEKFDNIKFVLASDVSGNTPILSTTDKVVLEGATINTDLSGFTASDNTSLILLDNTEGKAAKRLINGTEGEVFNANDTGSFVAINSIGYSDDEDKVAIDVKNVGAAGAFIDKDGNLTGKMELTLGDSTASNARANVRAGFSRASEGSDLSDYEDIYGFYSAGEKDPTGPITVNIVSAIDYSNTVLHGGYKNGNRYAKNTKLVIDSLNVKLKGVTDFETMTFNLPAETRNGDTMLKVTEAVDMAQTKTVVEAKKATGLKAGDSVNLIDSEVGIQNFDTKKYTVSGLTDKTGEVKVEDKALVLALDENGEKPNKNTKAPVEGISATMALVNQANELASNKLNRSMIAAVASANGDSATFASMNGGHNKYKTGSYVEADSWNIGFGLAKKGMSSKNPDSTYGLFFQYGKSNFDTHNDGGFRGDGDSKMFGAGLMFHQEARSKYYYHGNVFAGKVDAKWSSSEGRYDDKAAYYGMTFGMGHKHNAGGKKIMDVYGRYSFSHVGSMNGDLNGLKYDFDSTCSHNLRLGLRMEYDQKRSAKAYWGLAWEHEFAGDSKATVATLGRTDTPTLNGNTGIAEIGYEWKRGDWDYSINAEGFFGKREGVTGTFNINYNF